MPDPIALPNSLQQSFLGELSQKIQNTARQRKKLDLLRWTMRHRRFDDKPPSIPFPLIDVYRDMSPEVVFMKAAQIGISEWGINIVLWGADQHWADRGVCLYVFPKQEQCDDFSQDRVQRAIKGSYYLSERMGQIDRSDNANRTRLRKVGGNPIYFRGSDSVMQTRAIDADIVIADEVDLFRDGAIERVKERMGSSMSPLFRAFSQPLYPGGPIDRLFEDSDQRYYFLTCESCNEKQKLEWELNVEFPLDYSECRIVCKKCKKPLDRLGKGEWIPQKPGNPVHGYQMSKLYSPRANLTSILRKSLNVVDTETVQSFFNADLGIPHRPDGTPGLEDFKREYYPWHSPLQETYIGIDVGKVLHFVAIGRDYVADPLKLLHLQTCETFDELQKVYWAFTPRFTIIDGQGDPRATFEWAERNAGNVARWFHRPGANEPKFFDNNDEVHFNRTALLDNMFSNLKQVNGGHKVWLHVQAGQEFFDHLEANIREIVTDPNGRLVPRYTPIKPDHYAFALAYAILAAGTGPGAQQALVIPRYESSDEDEAVRKEIISGQGVNASWNSWGTTGAGDSKWSRWKN